MVPKRNLYREIHDKAGMMIGMSLIAVGLLVIGFSLFGLTNNPLSPETWLQISHQHYVVLFGVGFLLIGIRMLRKKKV